MRFLVGVEGATGEWLRLMRPSREQDRPATALYRAVGFEHADSPDFAMAMTLRPDTSETDGCRAGLAAGRHV